jgi:hypothetical protein
MHDRVMGSILAGAALCLAACAQDQPKTDDAVLAALQARLPGRYDNTAQARAAAGAPGAPAAIDLLIMPANAIMVGKAAYYVRETVAGDPHRLLSQYIWVFGRTVELPGKGAHAHQGDKADKQEHLEQHIYLFKEPHRWTRVGEQPELLESLLPDDLQRLTGCELLWTRTETGFTAERRSTSCSPAVRSEGQLLEQRVELHDNQLGLLEQQVGADGLIDSPAAASDPYYRFIRRGAAN